MNNEAYGRLPACPKCGVQSDDSALGRIGRLIICDCAGCAERFLVEEVPANSEEIEQSRNRVPKKYRKKVSA